MQQKEQQIKLSHEPAHFSEFNSIPPILHIETQRLIHTLINQNGWLLNEVKQLKHTLKNTKAYVSNKMDQIMEAETQNMRLTSTEKKKKNFKKSVNCPYQSCNHKYSSKIALNCHIRIKHCVKIEE